MTEETHIIDLDGEMIKVEVTEDEAAVLMTVYRKDISRPIDMRAFSDWLVPIARRYEHDPRPLALMHAESGRTAVILSTCYE